MDSLKFYKIKPSYLNYLRNRQPKVLQKSNRMYIGVVLKINNISYFAPLCSPKLKTKAWTSKKTDVFLIKSGELGFIDFANMIPVKIKNIISIDPKTFEDEKYARLLGKQYKYINKHNETILKRATTIYNMKIKNKQGFKACLDFCELEKLYHRFK